MDEYESILEELGLKMANQEIKNNSSKLEDDGGWIVKMMVNMKTRSKDLYSSVKVQIRSLMKLSRLCKCGLVMLLELHDVD